MISMFASTTAACCVQVLTSTFAWMPFLIVKLELNNEAVMHVLQGLQGIHMHMPNLCSAWLLPTYA